jgi:hypothetical protein
MLRLTIQLSNMNPGLLLAQIITEIRGIADYSRYVWLSNPRRADPRSEISGSISPPGGDVHEFYLTLKNDVSSLGRITELFEKKKVEVLGSHFQISPQDKRAHAIFYVEMSTAISTIAQLVDELNRDRSVIEVAATSKNKSFFESNMFPPTSGGHYRVFIMGADSWINLVRSFKQKFGTPADSILYSQGVSAGIEMARGIESRVGADEKEAEPKLSNLRGLFRATGLGLLEISGHREDFKLTISESMGARLDFVDNFVVGIAAGALGRLFAKEYVVSDLKHNPKGGVTTFRLM